MYARLTVILASGIRYRLHTAYRRIITRLLGRTSVPGTCIKSSNNEVESRTFVLLGSFYPLSGGDIPPRTASTIIPQILCLGYSTLYYFGLCSDQSDMARSLYNQYDIP